jgi:hypothetical protein
MYEGDDVNLDETPPEESSNRTFYIIAAILGGLILLSLACVAGYVLLVYQPAAQNRAAQQATLAAQNIQVEQGLTGTAVSVAATQTAFATPTLPPTNTPVFSTATATPTSASLSDPATATVAAALTQAAQAQLTVIPTSTALPGTGFADEAGVPGLVIMAVALIVVIFLARRLRTAPVSNK